MKCTPLMRANDQPAIELNKEKMEKFAPELKKYYYDPAKYKTYLEQLGILYPTVRSDSERAVSKVRLMLHSILMSMFRL